MAGEDVAIPSDENGIARCRLFIGGLPMDVSGDDLHDRFSRLLQSQSDDAAHASLSQVEVHTRFPLSFAYVNVDGRGKEEACKVLMKTFDRSKWRKQVLRVEVAKTEYLDRLAEEKRVIDDKMRRKQEEAAKRREKLLSLHASGEGSVDTGVAFEGKKVVFDEDAGETSSEEEVAEDEASESSEEEDDSVVEEGDGASPEVAVAQSQEKVGQDVSSESEEENTAQAVEADDDKSVQEQANMVEAESAEAKQEMDDGQENEERKEEETEKEETEKEENEEEEDEDEYERLSKERARKGKRVFRPSKKATDEFGASEETVEGMGEKEGVSNADVIQQYEWSRSEEAEGYVQPEEEQMYLDMVHELFPEVEVEKMKMRIQHNNQKLEDKDTRDASWMGRMRRYDPLDMRSREQFEQAFIDERKRQQEEAKREVEQEARREERERQSKEVEERSGGDRFFSTSTSLSSLFSRVRKNSDDGEQGEAALDGLFTSSKSDASGFQLSSLFQSDGGEPIKETKTEGGWSFNMSFNTSGEEEKTKEKDNGTDVESEEETASKRTVEDLLELGRRFFKGDEEEEESKEADVDAWSEHKKKLTKDFKRKRKGAVQLKKRQKTVSRR